MNLIVKNKITEEELERFLEIGKLTILGHDLSTKEVGVSFTFDAKKQKSGEQWETEANSTVCF